MAPQSKSRLGPPPQLVPIVAQQQLQNHKKFQLKMKELGNRLTQRLSLSESFLRMVILILEGLIFSYMIFKVILTGLLYKEYEQLYILVIVEVLMGFAILTCLLHFRKKESPWFLYVSLTFFIVSSLVNFSGDLIYPTFVDILFVYIFFLIIWRRSVVYHRLKEERKKDPERSEDSLSTSSSSELTPPEAIQRIKDPRTGDPGNSTVLSMDSLGLSSIGLQGALYNESAIDLEPIDFEYFVDEPSGSDNLFKVNLGDPPTLLNPKAAY